MATSYSNSDLAKEFELTTCGMRFYENMGLLQPERAGPSGWNRVHTARDRTRHKLALRAKRLSLSLIVAKEIIDSYDSPRGCCYVIPEIFSRADRAPGKASSKNA